MFLSDFDYILPEDLIAQMPASSRENSRMMTLNRERQSISHDYFSNIVNYLSSDDVLVLNNTKVIKARIFGEKLDTKGKMEIFLLKQTPEKNNWECLIRPSKRVKKNQIIIVGEQLQIEVLDRLDNGKWLIKFLCDDDSSKIIPKVGQIPLPPYIERKLVPDEIRKLDESRYQTVYAQKEGSVAAPTAGLHFTQDILDKLKEKGVEIAYVTLNVGLGTFKPVKCGNILEHKMDSECFEITKDNADIINSAVKKGKNIVAVGTTTVRTLETTMQKYAEIKPVNDFSELFIYPGYKFRIVNKLITNFHLPKSTLIMLTSAFAGKDFVFAAYEEAIKNKYRFYSYGDCMLIE